MAIYMKFGDIKGQVTTDGFKEWIELTSVQLGVNRSVSTGAGGRGREAANPSISDLVITKEFDVASSKLLQDAVAGTFNSKVEIKMTTTTKNKVDTFLALELTDCGVSSYSTSASSHEGIGGPPMESLSLNFTKIMYTPSPLDTKGTPVKGAVVTYDLKQMKAS